VATPTYATRESALAALDAADSARTHAKLDQALQAATDAINGATLRVFYPQVATRYFAWPNYQHADAGRLYLDADELVSVTSIVSGDDTLTAADYHLEPDTGPPYNLLVINPAGTGSLNSSSTTAYERSIAITGVYAGCRLVEDAAGATAEALDAIELDVDVTDGSLIGVGDLIRIDDERMVVTGRSMIDSAQNTTGALTASKADQTVGVASGAGFHVG
jgi:hypothetical protein